MPIRIFVSHVSTDKDAIARPLANALVQSGHEVWFDEFSLEVGDDLRESIEAGLANCDAGVVIVSPDFLSRIWTARELSALFSRETHARKMILPVWHGVTAEYLREKAPILAGRVAVRTDDGIAAVVSRLDRAIARRVDTVNRGSSGFGAQTYCLVITLDGQQILHRFGSLFEVTTGIPSGSVLRTQVLVSDDLSSILDYDSTYSFFELRGGVRVGITNVQVAEAARSLALDIPSRYKAVGMGFPEPSQMDQDALAYPLEHFSPNLVLMPEVESLQNSELPPFLHALLSCDSCSSGYFWGVGDLGIRTIQRFVDTGNQRLLAEAILAYSPGPPPSGLVELGWKLVKQIPQWTATDQGDHVLNALFKHEGLLTKPLVDALKAIKG